MSFTKMDKNVLNVSALPNTVTNQASSLKAIFDQAGADLKKFINDFIDELESVSASANIGANVEGVATQTVQAVLNAFNLALADRYTKTEIGALLGTETNDLVSDVDVDLTTGVITITKKDGATETFDTAMEKVPASFQLVEDEVTHTVYLKITNMDGTYTQTNVTELMNIYDFSNSTDINFSVNTDGYTKIIQASIKNNSIGLEKLSLEAVTTLQSYVASASANAELATNKANEASTSASEASVSETNAKTSETNAKTSEDNAKASEENAEESASNAESNAIASESYARGGTNTREGEDTDNAKYYYEQCQTLAEGKVTDVKVDGASVVNNSVANIDLSGKVDKVEGKDLSSNDYTNAEKNAVGTIANKEDISNKVVELSETSTNTQYPSAKAVFDAIQGAGGNPLTDKYNLPTYEHEGDLLIRDYFRKRFSNPLSNSSMFDAISNGKQILFSNGDEVAMYDYKTNSAVKVRGRRSNYDINLLTYEHDTFFIKDSGTSSSAGNRIEYYEPSMGAFQPISVQANIFVKDIAFNGTTYVIACDDGMYYLDGYPQVQTWVKALAVNYMQGVTYANNCFLATGNGGTYKSLNGIEWQKISNNGTSAYGQDGGLKYINNTYIAFNTYSADDGITWQTVPKTGYGLTYINGLWVNTKGYSDSIDNTEWHDLNIPYYYKYNIVPCYNKLIALDANELAEFIPTYSTTNIILNKPLSEYTTNMRVLIDLKDMSFGETTNININGLGNKKLNCTKYDLMCMKSELIYNGEKFNVNNLFLE